MHLSDDKLFELDAKGKQHLRECSSCRQRAAYLAKFRRSLSNMPVKEIPNDNWEKIRASLEQRVKDNHKSRFLTWRYVTTALAASFVFVVISFKGTDFYSPRSDAKTKVAELIEHNNRLQASLFLLVESRHHSEFELASIRYEINAIDNRIQKAYLNNHSYSEVAKLWEKKLKVLNRYLLLVNNNGLLKV